MKIERHLVIPGKLAYVLGDRAPVDCILCAVRDHDPRVQRLVVAESGLMLVSLNLFPYSPGHLLIFPRRHVLDLRELTEPEVLELDRVQRLAVAALEELYLPTGFNIGYNMGPSSGASIPHLHCHVVPRHQQEVSLLEVVLTGSSRMAEDPRETVARLREAFARRVG